MYINKNDNSMPGISIVVICYNQEKYINECLRSLTTQTYAGPIEILVADDSSSDKTTDIIQDFFKNKKIDVNLIFNNENVGAVNNLKNALNKCKHDLVAICEGDDYWLDSRKLTVQQRLLNEHQDIDIVFSKAIALKKDNSSLICDYGDMIKVFRVEEVIRRRGGFIPTASILVRKECIIDRLPAWMGDLPGCDHYLKILGSMRSGALYVPHVFSAYRVKSEGSWNSMNETLEDVQIYNLEGAWSGSLKLQAMIGHSGSFQYLRYLYCRQVTISKLISEEKKAAFIQEKLNSNIKVKLLWFLYSNIPFKKNVLSLVNKFRG